MTNQKATIAVLILAAGASKRMGSIKQLLAWADTSLLGHAVKMAKSSKAKKTIVVLGANAKAIAAQLSDCEVQLVKNDNWASGMGSSIATGVECLMGSGEKFDAVLITLADQPLIDTPYLDLMIETAAKVNESIVATAYGNKAGVPALFGRQYFETLMALESEQGAKEVLDWFKSDIFRLDPGSKTLDIDTMKDYEAFKKK
jgi:molybdenum cofactor cytidylyltransferase